MEELKNRLIESKESMLNAYTYLSDSEKKLLNIFLEKSMKEIQDFIDIISD